MKPMRFFLALFFAATLTAHATDTLSLRAIWRDILTNGVTAVRSNFTSVSIVALPVGNTASLTPASHIGFSFYQATPFSITLGGDVSDPNNPVLSSYVPGATSATLRFFHNISDADHPKYVVNKTMTLTWSHKTLNLTFTAAADVFDFANLMNQSSPPPAHYVGTLDLTFGNYVTNIPGVYVYTEKLTATNSVVLHSGSFTLSTDVTPPTISISSPRANTITTNAITTVKGTAHDDKLLAVLWWRLARPGDNPASGASSFEGYWNPITADYSQLNNVNWTFNLDLSAMPGTNHLWVAAQDFRQQWSPIATRDIFYSVRSQLTLGTNGSGTVTGGPGVTNGAMLEIGRGYFVTAKPKNTNSYLRDWLDVYGKHYPAHSPFHFMMGSNMTIIANFIPNPFPAIASNYTGLFYDPTNGPSTNSSGYVNFTVLPTGTFSGTLLIGTQRLPFSGNLVFDIDATDVDAVNGTFTIATATRPIHGNIRFPSDGSGNLSPNPSGNISFGSPQPGVPAPVALSVKASVYNSNAVPPGVYHVIDTTGSGEGPSSLQGFGFASIAVSSKGQLTVKLQLADGSPAITFSTVLAADNTAPIFVPLYKGKGMLIGWIDMGAVASGNAAGATWIKLPNPLDKFLPEGFSRDLSLRGGRYTPTDAANRFAHRTAQFYAELPSGPFYANVLYDFRLNNFVVPAGQGSFTLKFSFVPATGLCTGTLTIPGQPIWHINSMFSALNTNEVDGYSLSTNFSAFSIIR
jgi:hypothetical protein